MVVHMRSLPIEPVIPSVVEVENTGAYTKTGVRDQWVEMDRRAWTARHGRRDGEAPKDGGTRRDAITQPNADVLTINGLPVEESKIDGRRVPQDVVRLSNKARMALAALEVLKKINGDDANLTGQKEADIIAQAMAVGTDGDDYFQLLSNVIVAAGAGDDTVEVQNDSAVDGGDGDDAISAGDNAVVAGGHGDDLIDVYANGRVDAGDGDDLISGYENLTADGGRGNDHIRAYQNAHLLGGDGNDYLAAGDGSLLDGGSGDDIIFTSGVESPSTVIGGAGDDELHASGAEVHYNLGDGHDVLVGGRKLIFGEGISAGDISVELSETGHVRMVIGEGPEAGSITLGWFDGRFDGTDDWMVFEDGSKLNLHQKVRDEIGLVMKGRVFLADPNAWQMP